MNVIILKSLWNFSQQKLKDIMIFENRARSALVKYSILLLIKDMASDDWWEQSWFCWICRNWKLVRGESHIYFCVQCVKMTLGGGVWGVITNDVLKFRKIIDFQSSWIVMNCQFTSSYNIHIQLYLNLLFYNQWFKKPQILQTFFKKYKSKYVLH